MRWIALYWPVEPGACRHRDARAWRALGYTPHVAWTGDVLLLEVARCARLWGGRRTLLDALLTPEEGDASPARWAQGASSLVALARVRMRSSGQAYAPRVRDLPLNTLDAARPHLPILERLGCRTWGDGAALPRVGLARRFGPQLGQALDVAWGRAPDVYDWIIPPERFDQTLELPRRADTAPALLWGGHRLLLLLQQWLVARNRGVLALSLAWTFDQLRLNGRDLPPEQSLTLRTAEPAQSLKHIQRLLAIRLERTRLLAPAHTLRLRVLETVPWQARSAGLLPEDAPHGQALHQFLERAQARLGASRVRLGAAVADYRPECRQIWLPADSKPASGTGPGWAAGWPDGLSPAWLLREPRALLVSDDGPEYAGRPLDLLVGPYRVESGWWSGTVTIGSGRPAARDYFVAQAEASGLLLIYRERPTAGRGHVASTAWFLQGIYG